MNEQQAEALQEAAFDFVEDVQNSLGHPKAFDVFVKKLKAMGMKIEGEPPQNQPTEFYVGTKVEKSSGYRWPGIVVAVFRTTAGDVRYVVECTNPDVAGALHIYNASQLRHV